MSVPLQVHWVWSTCNWGDLSATALGINVVSAWKSFRLHSCQLEPDFVCCPYLHGVRRWPKSRLSPLTKKKSWGIFSSWVTHEFPHELLMKYRIPHEDFREEFSFLIGFPMRISVPHEFPHEDLLFTRKLAHFLMRSSWGNRFSTRTSWGFFHEELDSSWVPHEVYCE